jgi:hypothetical protein
MANLHIYFNLFFLFQQDIVGTNDSLGEAILSLTPLYRKAMKKNESCKVEDMWVKCTHPNFKGVRVSALQISIFVISFHTDLAINRNRGKYECQLRYYQQQIMTFSLLAWVETPQMKTHSFQSQNDHRCLMAWVIC